MSDELEWTGADDAMLHAASLTEVHPTFTAMHFMAALSQLPASLDYLASKVTPESRTAWGDFSKAANFNASLFEPGIVSIVRADPTAMDVAWVLVVENIGNGGWKDGLPPDGSAAAYLTMVNRPALGGWRVHHLGDEIELSRVPRDESSTTPGPDKRPASIGQWIRRCMRKQKS